MINVTLLGSSGSIPLPRRPLTSAYMTIDSKGVLVDCGEGTQVSISNLGKKLLNIDIICITHQHADHILGLPGLISTYNQTLFDNKRKKRLIMMAPTAAKQSIEALLSTVNTNQLHIIWLWLTDTVEEYNFGDIRIKAAKLSHSVDCYGYCIIQPNKGHFVQELAERYNVPQKFWSILQYGYAITTMNGILDINQINKTGQYDCQVCYATDTRVCEGLYLLAQNADLAIIEGMSPDNCRKSKGSNKHLLYSQAATVAKECNVTELWLTHFSQTNIYPHEHLSCATDIFKNTKCGSMGMSREVKFRDDLEKKEEPKA